MTTREMTTEQTEGHLTESDTEIRNEMKEYLERQIKKRLCYGSNNYKWKDCPRTATAVFKKETTGRKRIRQERWEV